MDVLERTLMTLSCSDCDIVPKMPDAGRIIECEGRNVQIMHNGLRVVEGGYHGDWMAQIIRGLRGHHEPQEELVFHELLRLVRHRTTIVELGAFWSYYSLWYLSEIPHSRAICVEPDPNNISVGRENARLNGLEHRVAFHEAWIGGSSAELEAAVESDGSRRRLPQIDMPTLRTLTAGGPIEMLHVDTQGAEIGFVTSIRPEDVGALRFVVISTHHPSASTSGHTHGRTIEGLREKGAHILLEHDVHESYSGDGLVVASFAPQDAAVSLPPI